MYVNVYFLINYTDFQNLCTVSFIALCKKTEQCINTDLIEVDSSFHSEELYTGSKDSWGQIPKSRLALGWTWPSTFHLVCVWVHVCVCVCLLVCACVISRHAQYSHTRVAYRHGIIHHCMFITYNSKQFCSKSTQWLQCRCLFLWRNAEEKNTFFGPISENDTLWC